MVETRRIELPTFALRMPNSITLQAIAVIIFSNIVEYWGQIWDSEAQSGKHHPAQKWNLAGENKTAWHYHV